MPGFKKLLNNVLLLSGLASVAMCVCACGPANVPMRHGRKVLPLSQDIALDIDADKDGYAGLATRPDFQRLGFL